MSSLKRHKDENLIKKLSKNEVSELFPEFMSLPQQGFELSNQSLKGLLKRVFVEEGILLNHVSIAKDQELKLKGNIWIYQISGESTLEITDATELKLYPSELVFLPNRTRFKCSSSPESQCLALMEEVVTYRNLINFLMEEFQIKRDFEKHFFDAFEEEPLLEKDTKLDPYNCAKNLDTFIINTKMAKFKKRQQFPLLKSLILPKD
jgi:hypothetical protein